MSANKYDTIRPIRYTFATGGCFGSTAFTVRYETKSLSTQISYFAPAHLFSMFQTGLPPGGKEGAYFLPVTISGAEKLRRLKGRGPRESRVLKLMGSSNGLVMSSALLWMSHYLELDAFVGTQNAGCPSRNVT